MNIRIYVRALSVAMVLAFVFFVATAPTQATPITFGFVSQLPLGTTYGTGSLTFDNSLLVSPFPRTITQLNITGFSYVDPNVGTLNNLFSLTLTFASATTPSFFAFVATGPGGLFVGNSSGGTISASEEFTFPTLLLPVASIPEPSSLLLLGTGLMGIAALRKLRRF